MSIRSYLQEGFEQDLFEASMKNLTDASNPIALNSFSYSLRELIANYLDRVAPVVNTKNCAWFFPNEEATDGVTRAHKIKYSIQGGLSDEFVINELGIDISNTVREMSRTINTLSKYTHIRPNTFNLSDETVKTESKKILRAFRDTLKLKALQNAEINESLWCNIDESVIDTAIADAVQGIDELASHHYIEEAQTDEICITHIDDQFVIFLAEGYVQCELQWGSNRDQIRGDGHTMKTSFPFTCYLKSPVADPYNVATDGSQFEVDSSSWYGE